MPNCGNLEVPFCFFVYKNEMSKTKATLQVVQSNHKTMKEKN